MRTGKVALYVTTCGVLEASVNIYSVYLTEKSHEGFGDVKIQGQVNLTVNVQMALC
jgi:hypothetical protein